MSACTPKRHPWRCTKSAAWWWDEQAASCGRHRTCECAACVRARQLATEILIFGLALAVGLTVGAWL